MADKLKLLVVDDHQIMRLLEKSMLGLDRFEFFEADSGITALEVLKTTDVDLILLDNHMPQMDGICFLETAKTLPKFKAKVIMVTASRSQETIGAAASLGVSGYLCKLIDPKALNDMVSEALGLSPADRPQTTRKPLPLL